MPEQTISKRDNTWLFQVCKHLISCILQCAIRDHLGHICCKLKHFMSRPHFVEKLSGPPKGDYPPAVAKLGSEMSMFNILPENVYFHVWIMDNYAQPLFGH